MQALKRLLSGFDGASRNGTSPRESFDQARALAGQTNTRQVVIVRPDLSLLVMACPDPDSMSREVLQQVHRLVPPSVRRDIAVIASTDFGGNATPGEVTRAIPFFGLLQGLGSVGHTVWIFSPGADMMAACRDADIVIVDSAVAGDVPLSALDAAREVMRASFILLHDRASGQLRPFARR